MHQWWPLFLFAEPVRHQSDQGVESFGEMLVEDGLKSGLIERWRTRRCGRLLRREFLAVPTALAAKDGVKLI